MAKNKEKETKNVSLKERLEEHHIALILKNAEMISSAVNIAKHLSIATKCGPDGVMTMMVLVVGDFIEDMAKSIGAPKERIMDNLLDAIREYVNEYRNDKESN